ncbi:MAG: hypothetical protein KatS3mg131_2346 [Candidatus Tectimicrobiota bacterium]|nr:MAG: hypothetical protein KatS3mg131_2346 [Candidatus Tectomicrobia bacterium]
MLALKRIVLATDFSPCAEAALRYAAVLARMTQAELLLTHVIDTRVVALPRWTDIFRSTEVFAAMEAAETEAMQQLLARPLLKDLPVRPEVLRGHPVDRLIDVAAFADLAVLGTHGRSAERGKPAGTVARHVAHGSATPTLLVPPGGGTAGLPAEDAQRLDMRRVLLAIHFAQYAPQAPRAGARLRPRQSGGTPRLASDRAGQSRFVSA